MWPCCCLWPHPFDLPPSPSPPRNFKGFLDPEISFCSWTTIWINLWLDVSWRPLWIPWSNVCFPFEAHFFRNTRTSLPQLQRCVAVFYVLPLCLWRLASLCPLFTRALLCNASGIDSEVVFILVGTVKNLLLGSRQRALFVRTEKHIRLNTSRYHEVPRCQEYQSTKGIKAPLHNLLCVLSLSSLICMLAEGAMLQVD